MVVYRQVEINVTVNFVCLSKKPGFEDESSFDRSPVLRYCAVSSIEHSHKTVITDLEWLPDHMEVSLTETFH